MILRKPIPSMDAWLKEAKAHASAPKIGMYLIHNGTVRQSARAKVRDGAEDTKPVTGMLFSYDQEKVDAVIAETYKGGDIRPRVIEGLSYLVGRIKKECVMETELYAEE